MDKKDIAFLEEKSKHTRRLIVDEIGKLGVGHIGGCLSVVETLVVLYHKVMKIDPSNPQMEGRDRFVMSKGHAGPAVYAVLADKGYFDVSELDTLNKPETRLPSHCDMLKTRGVDMTAGSLGQGISCAVGMAKASKIKKDNANIFCMIGDGESQEGQVWEAAMAAAHFKLNNLIVFTDNNKLQIDDETTNVLCVEPIADKWNAFGWNVLRANGHCVEEIYNSVMEAKKSVDKPTMIVLDTVKGKGVSFIEAMGVKNHSTNISEEQRLAALKELE